MLSLSSFEPLTDLYLATERSEAENLKNVHIIILKLAHPNLLPKA